MWAKGKTHTKRRGSRTTFFVDLNEADPERNTALMLAVKLRRQDCVRVLCDHFADPNYTPFSACMAPS